MVLGSELRDLTFGCSADPKVIPRAVNLSVSLVFQDVGTIELKASVTRPLHAHEGLKFEVNPTSIILPDAADSLQSLRFNLTLKNTNLIKMGAA